MISEHKKYTVFIIVLTVVCSLIFFSGIGEANDGLIDKIVHLIIGFTAVFFGVLWLKSNGLKSHQGKAVLLFSLTLFLWITGNLLWWFVYSEALVSIADILWLLGYPFLMIGLLYGIHMKGAEILKEKKKLIFSVIAIFIFGFIYFAFFPPVWDPSLSDIENTVTIGYVIADIFLIIPLVLLVTFSLGGKSTVSSIFFAVAIIVTLANDIIYAASFDTNIYEGLIDLISSSTYILFSLAFIYMEPESE